MKILDRLKKFIKAADNVATTKICKFMDEKTKQLDKYANPPKLVAWNPPKMEQIRIDPKTSPDEAIDIIAKEITKVGYSFQEARDALTAFIHSISKPEPLSHATNNWRKMHCLPMRRKLSQERRRKR